MRRHFVMFITMVMALFATAVSSLAMAIYINKNNSELGWFVADKNWMTLYTFSKDSPGKSACGAANDCIKKWPPFHTDAIDAELPMKNEDFATIVRDDGTKQTTYKGMPLYYFTKDTKPGDVNGQGVNNVWFVVKP